MANEEQEINQQPDNASPLTDSLVATTSEAIANPAEGTEPTAANVVESQSDPSGEDTATTSEPVAETPVVEPADEAQLVAATGQPGPATTA
ncbi:MAG TPA: hypothetical protein VK404_07595, partial [Spirosoma sp.]|nr:hypothetical protein [Spirosoma sp.]